MTIDYCYNCAKLKTQNFSVYQNKSVLFPPEKYNGAKVDLPVISPAIISLDLLGFGHNFMEESWKNKVPD